MVGRKQIKTFDIILVTSKNFLGASIRKFTNSFINHTGVCVWVDDELYISEAEKYGLCMTRFKDFITKPKYKKFYIAKIKFQEDALKQFDFKHFAISQSGHKPYDFINLFIHQPVKHITKKMAKWPIFKYFIKGPVWIGKNSENANRRFVCAEWCAYVLNKYFSVCRNFYLISPEWFLDNVYFDIKELKLKLI